MATDVGMEGRWSRVRLVGWSMAAALLLLPALAMQFTAEVAWTAADFVTFAAMLAVLGGGIELAVRRTGDPAYRAGSAFALLAAFLLFWLSGAVGIIGSEDNPANLAYLGLIGLVLVGSALARFRATGLARMMRAAALVQALIGAAAIAFGLGEADPNWPADVVVLTIGFAALWLLAARLFGRSSSPAAMR